MAPTQRRTSTGLVSDGPSTGRATPGAFQTLATATVTSAVRPAVGESSTTGAGAEVVAGAAATVVGGSGCGLGWTSCDGRSGRLRATPATTSTTATSGIHAVAAPSG